MEYKEAKRELKSYARLKKKSLQYLERIKQLDETIKSAGGQKISGMPSAQGKISDLSDYMAQKEALECRRGNTVKKVAEIETKIALVDDDILSEVLRKRYKEEKCWSETADYFCKSEVWAKKKNKPAIQAYAELS